MKIGVLMAIKERTGFGLYSEAICCIFTYSIFVYTYGVKSRYLERGNESKEKAVKSIFMNDYVNVEREIN